MWSSNDLLPKKTKKEKLGYHKQTLYRLFTKYLPDEFEKALGKVMFHKYDRHRNVNKEYHDFFSKTDISG